MARSRNRRPPPLKLLRTIRLDPSDTFVFERAAEPGEWAVSGAFLFADADPQTLSGKPRAAFRSGFLGVPSLGWSTLVQIVETDEADRAALVGMVAKQLHERLGAPDLAAARAASEQEVAFAASLCDHPLDTLIAVRRTFEGSDIREAFRTLRPRGTRKPMRAFSLVEVEGEGGCGRRSRGSDHAREGKAERVLIRKAGAARVLRRYSALSFRPRARRIYPGDREPESSKHRAGC